MWILMVVLAVLAGGAVVLYNRLVQMRERVDASWADIDVQLKRRHDLIPNLVETVKGYATHERDTLERVIQARNAAMTARGPDEQGRAESALASSLRSIFALSEAYPDLKANQNFRQLQDSLTSLEDHIQRARSTYNRYVRDYNTSTRQVPTDLVATAFAFRAREVFEIGEAERAAPQVNFSEGKGTH